MVLIFQFISALLLTLVINSLGKVSKGFGYVNLSNVPAEGLLGYNLVFRILAPSVYIAFLSVGAYLVGWEAGVNNIWLIALWYTLINISVVYLLGRFPLISKGLYLFIQSASVFMAYLLYKFSFSHGLQAILPDEANFKTELWIILLIFFYSLLNSYESSSLSYFSRKEKYIRYLYAQFSKKYGSLLKNFIGTNIFLEKLFFSIMIVESLNRSKPLRLLERLLFPFGLIKTTGIMQVSSTRPLSDEESIQLAQERILNSYNKFIKKISINYELARAIISDYNNGQSYFESIIDTYNMIDTNNTLYGRVHLLNSEPNNEEIEKLKTQIKELLVELKNAGVKLDDIFP